MSILSYIIWNGSPEIFQLGSFSLRWYGLFFALGFLISQQILYYMYKREGKPVGDVDTLTIYMVVATILGARLGHVIFYQPELIWEEPWSIFLPFEFSPFRFTGLQGLASHGGAIGILFALWLYARKRKPGQSYFQVLDRIVILVALTGALIRFGNYFNSEIIGKPTDKPFGVVFTGRLTESLLDERVDREGILEDVAYVKNDSTSSEKEGLNPMGVYLFFKSDAQEAQIEDFISGPFKTILADRMYEFFDIPSSIPLDYKIAKTDAKNGFIAKIKVTGISRHPAQLYEAVSCILLFVVLLLLWWRSKENLVPGRLFAIFLIWCFGMRFLFEYLKENQEAFEASLPINMGQILSIPLVVAGIGILIYTFVKKEAKNS